VGEPRVSLLAAPQHQKGGSSNILNTGSVILGLGLCACFLPLSTHTHLCPPPLSHHTTERWLPRTQPRRHSTLSSISDEGSDASEAEPTKSSMTRSDSDGDLYSLPRPTSQQRDSDVSDASDVSDGYVAKEKQWRSSRQRRVSYCVEDLARYSAVYSSRRLTSRVFAGASILERAVKMGDLDSAASSSSDNDGTRSPPSRRPSGRKARPWGGSISFSTTRRVVSTPPTASSPTRARSQETSSEPRSLPMLRLFLYTLFQR
jgi:hypothetical protein